MNIWRKFKSKILILIGSRQVGKTSLLKYISEISNVKSVWLNADESDIKSALTNATTNTRLLQLIGNETKLVVIDEAQQIPDIGLKLKLIYDTKPELQIIATGSSAYDLSNNLNEPLTGRKKTFHLFPISFNEYANHNLLIVLIKA